MTGGAAPPRQRPAEGVGQEHAGPSLADAVLGGDHQPVAGGVGQHGRIGLGHHPHVPDGGVDPLGHASSSAADSAGVEHLPHGQDAHRAVTGAGAAGVQARSHRPRGHPRGRGLREADDRGSVEA